MRVHTLYPTCASMPQCHRSHSKPRPVTRPTVLHRRPNMRIRVVPVLGTQPAMFGQAAAAHVLTTLGRKPFRPHTVEPVSRSFSAKQCDRLKTREKRIFHNAPAPTTPGSSDAAPYTPVADCNEAAYVIESLWNSKSAFSDIRIDSRKVFELTRFDRSKPALPYNLIFVTREEVSTSVMPPHHGSCRPYIGHTRRTHMMQQSIRLHAGGAACTGFCMLFAAAEKHGLLVLHVMVS
eukprot:m.368186 g.368186  ORF g.368186 m.368186 type:complete len:235 (-) comp20842_c1_seq17:46-750(-)